MNNPLFSIIVASYNNGKYLPECLDSLINQTYTNIEIIVVDDASNDNSVEIVKHYMAKDTRIKLWVNKKNKGVGYTKNKGVDEANGIILGFVDADDYLTINAVEVMMLEHSKSSEASLIYSTHYIPSTELNKLSINKRVGAIEQGSFLRHSHKTKIIAHFASFKKSSYLLCAPLDISLKKAIDHDLYYKLEEVGATKFINKPLYYYRQHSGSISLNLNIWRARIWDLKTKTNAYYRRLKMPNIPNLTKEELNLEAIFVYKQSALFELKNSNYNEYFKSIFALLKYLGFKEYLKFVYYSVKKTIKPNKFKHA